MFPEKSAPEQLWVLSRGRHSSETHFLLPMESESVEEFDVSSVDWFLLRKCLSRRGKERLFRAILDPKENIVIDTDNHKNRWILHCINPC